MGFLSSAFKRKKVDSLPDFPRNAVHTGTEAVLTSVFKWERVEPSPYGRPILLFVQNVYKAFAITNKHGKKINIKQSPRRAGDPAVLVASSEKIRKDLGWQPKYSNIHTIIQTAWNWQKSHPKGSSANKLQ